MRRFMLLLAVVATGVIPIVLFLGRTPAVAAKPQPLKNAQMYVFHSSLIEVRQGIRKAFEGTRWRGMSLDLGDVYNPTLTGSLSDHLTSPDARLNSYHDSIGKSQVYSVAGKPAEYVASFDLWVVPVADRQTRVMIGTRSEVIAGKKFGFGSCGPGFANRYVPVEPTTIEEYEILLRIGAELGEKGMPALVLP